jgi:hypothetical protein
MNFQSLVNHDRTIRLYRYDKMSEWNAFCYRIRRKSYSYKNVKTDSLLKSIIFNQYYGAQKSWRHFWPFFFVVSFFFKLCQESIRKKSVRFCHQWGMEHWTKVLVLLPISRGGIQSNMSQRPPPISDHLSITTTILKSHLEYFLHKLPRCT